MDITACEKYLLGIFGPSAEAPDEFGVTCDACKDITRIGYATNLTPEVIEAARERKVDLIVTHHDAWSFLYGMKEACLDLLNRYGMSHIYAHLPLDAAEFGTAAALVGAFGAQVEEKVMLYEGYLCGRTGSLPEPMDFQAFVARVQDVCGEKVFAWKNSDKPVKKIGLVPGGGIRTDYVKECVDHHCDVFITGEKLLYTIEYAKFAGIHMIVGSHTVTEVFGVQALVEKLREKFPDVQSVQIPESHLENPIGRE